MLMFTRPEQYYTLLKFTYSYFLSLYLNIYSPNVNVTPFSCWAHYVARIIYCETIFFARWHYSLRKSSTIYSASLGSVPIWHSPVMYSFPSARSTTRVVLIPPNPCHTQNQSPHRCACLLKTTHRGLVCCIEHSHKIRTYLSKFNTES